LTSDYDQWKRLVVAAKVPDGRLHDARHTATTVLLLSGVPERTVLGIMGWSNTAMAARYQHITATIRRDVAQRVRGLLWAADEKAVEPRSGDDEGAATREPVPAA
jgi:integrase